jgi:Phosphatidylserine/phosphatidylglycerophosphate/cardiolipin synthases and related enzymes
MDDAEFLGGVLHDAADPYAAARVLTALLLSQSDRTAARRADFDPDLVDVVRAKLGGDPDRMAMACTLGAAWIMGRRSVAAPEPWELVASLPPGTRLPAGLRRTTGETLMQVVVEATRTLRLVSPFIDRPALDFLADALAAATLRGVRLEVLLPTRSTHAGDALDELRRTIREHGRPEKLAVCGLQGDAPWAHLKVLTADSTVAYIGSANVTAAGIAGANLELGVLVRGSTVAVVEGLLDQFRQH